jgi:hypothetical protein
MCTGDCGDAVTLSYINLLTGVQTSVAPDGFQAYNCDAVPQYTQKCVPYLETETFDASAGQTVFTIANVASGDVRFSRNGATLHDAAAVVSGSVVTYVPGPNNAEVLLANDRIEISYLYVVCEDSLPVDYVLKDCIGNELPTGTEFVTCAALDSDDFTIEANGNIKVNAGGQALTDCKGTVLPNGTSVLKCDALNPDHFEIDPTTGEISSKCCSTVANSFACWTTSTPGTPSGQVAGQAVVALPNASSCVPPSPVNPYGTPTGATGVNAPYYQSAGSTVMSISDDNGVAGSYMWRIDCDDILKQNMACVKGIQYKVTWRMRKVDNTSASALLTFDARRPDGTKIANVVYGGSSKVGGGAGWDTYTGYFTADVTGTWTAEWRGYVAAAGNTPANQSAARVIDTTVQVFNTSGEVIEPVTTSQTIDKVSTTTGGVTTVEYFKNGVQVFPAAGSVVDGACAAGRSISLDVEKSNLVFADGVGIQITGSGTPSDPYVISLRQDVIGGNIDPFTPQQ